MRQIIMKRDNKYKAYMKIYDMDNLSELILIFAFTQGISRMFRMKLYRVFLQSNTQRH
jgi:hypothetical protein